MPDSDAASEGFAPEDFDPRRPHVAADPYPYLRYLQDHHPVFRSERLGGLVVTRHDDVRALLAEARFSADRMRPYFARLSPERRQAVSRLERLVTPWAVFNDPPVHTRLRHLLNRNFLPRVAALRPAVERLTEMLLAPLEGRSEIDIVADVAFPLPAAVILTLLGVPLDEAPLLRHWSDDLARFIGSAEADPAKYAAAETAVAGLAGVVAEQIAERRRRPRGDLLSALMQPGGDGVALDGDDLVATAILMLFAGHETTTHLIANGTLELLRHPAAAQAVRSDPGLAATAVDEVLRFQSPVAAVTRIAREAGELGGVRFERGELLFAMLGAANRDPRRFAAPDRFDVARAPNPMLSFGYGIHFCLGAPLARLEGQVVLPALLRRFPRLALRETEASLAWHRSIVLRGLLGLRVAPGGS